MIHHHLRSVGKNLPTPDYEDLLVMGQQGSSLLIGGETPTSSPNGRPQERPKIECADIFKVY